jgi:hypothetical protein
MGRQTGVAGLAARSAVALVLVTALEATTLGAVTGNVADLAALVALLATTHTGTATGSTALGAVARDVTSLTTAVAGLLLLGVGALAREMALATAVVAGGVALGGAVAGLVGNVAACSEAGQSVVLYIAGEACSRDCAHLNWHLSSRQMAIAQMRAVTARVKKTYSCSKRGQSWEGRGHRSSAC